MNNTKMWEEIYQQEKIIEDIFSNSKNNMLKIATQYKQMEIQEIQLMGRGSSDHAALFAKYFYERFSDLNVKILEPSLVTQYSSIERNFSNVLSIGISQSGGAEDINLVQKEVKRQGGLTVNITNNPSSLMSQNCYCNLDCECGVEKSVTATKSYTSQTVLLLILFMYLTDQEHLLDSLKEDIKFGITSGLEQEEQIREISHIVSKTNHMYLISRGLGHKVNLEAELKLQEASRINARAYASSDYYHGPISLAGNEILYMFLFIDDKIDQLSINLYKRLKDEFNIQPIIVTPTNSSIMFNEDKIIEYEKRNFISSYYTLIVITQMLACQTALIKGLDPDNPIGVSKSTVTI